MYVAENVASYQQNVLEIHDYTDKSNLQSVSLNSPLYGTNTLLELHKMSQISVL